MQPLRAIRARARSSARARRRRADRRCRSWSRACSRRLLLVRATRAHAWVGVLATVAIGGRRSRCAAARRCRASRSRRAAFLAVQPLGREVNDNVYAPFFAVLFVLFSFGLHERRGRVLLAGVAVDVRAATSIALAARRLLEHGDRRCIFGGLVIAGGPILLGRVIANRSRLNAALREKAERLRRERADAGRAGGRRGARADRGRAARRRRARDERDGRPGGRRAPARRARTPSARARRSPPSRTRAARR